MTEKEPASESSGLTIIDQEAEPEARVVGGLLGAPPVATAAGPGPATLTTWR